MLLAVSLRRSLASLAVLWILCVVGACRTDHYADVRELMKQGQLVLPAPVYELPIHNLLIDSAAATWVWATYVRLPPDTTRHLFLIDTGSPTVISRPVWQALGKQLLFAYEDDYTANHFDLSQIDSLCVGEAVFRQVGVVVEDFPPQSFFARYAIKGIIGGNMIEQAVWYFDGQQQRVSLHQQLTTIPLHHDFRRYAVIRDVWRVAKTYVFFNNFPQKQLTTLHTGFAGGLKVPLAEW